MKNIKTMNKIAKIGLDELDKDIFNISDDTENPEGILVRSASLHDMQFNPELKAIVRCGAGVNNIPTDKCAEQGIVVFNTPGANANGVKELTIASLLLASRKITDGINWANTLETDVAKQVEKGKSAFGGCEIQGKTLGVIGLGAIGGLAEMKKLNEKKAAVLYDYLDSQDYYIAPTEKGSRSMMNVTFVTGDADLDKKFASEAAKAGLQNLKGHRSVGGMRASIYNAMPYEGVVALVEFMKDFAEKNPK
jgi:hypothetical protein